ncbi:hypothetical protein GCM10017581_101180 [Dactylosporangium matsuzakiense]|uniref:Uncharacterized protein n=1 Tax=Dactylosporangium matsuzakiense TaxID=53360 RepID=A0A9W6KUL3_9ACTN|nr:hypothetical protein GCM10017581_101180 [Dactylosporangium matsuzakiense]
MRWLYCISSKYRVTTAVPSGPPGTAVGVATGLALIATGVGSPADGDPGSGGAADWEGTSAAELTVTDADA